MLETLVQLIVTPMVLLMASKVMKGVYVKDLKAAVFTSLAIFVVGFLAGWLLTIVFNIATMGLFWIVGLGVVTRVLANAVIIEVIDQYRDDFDTDGFLPSLWLAILLAITWGVIDYVF
ncbi:MAG: phage holin family protein [Roseivirga sp.]|nr:phage holin family protein [Roseivirga sp.]